MFEVHSCLVVSACPVPTYLFMCQPDKSKVVGGANALSILLHNLLTLLGAARAAAAYEVCRPCLLCDFLEWRMMERCGGRRLQDGDADGIFHFSCV